MGGSMFYEPKKGHTFSIDPYKSLIFPRPIGWISTISKNGIPNLAPYSYFNAIADDPPQVMFSEEAPIANNKYKDSLTNILSTKEFVVNFATSKTCKQMTLSSIDAPSDVDEFKFTKLKKRKSKKVIAPSVAESPVNLECKLLKTLKLKSNSKKYGTVVIGEVIGIFINNKFIKKGRVDSAAMRYVARLGYSEYTTISSQFRMHHPKWE
jgi:flavin reductase (DIM6/NTAB) family NADH-FMN oxidoreductase RutF|tara:strand:- start:1080 stop:1706 length:627 start_codon:yes stop_codon:yes gene_type:complete